MLVTYVYGAVGHSASTCKVKIKNKERKKNKSQNKF